MAIVITNGNQYVTYTETGAFKLMNKIENAHKFENANDAIKAMKNSEGKTRQKNLYVYDTDLQYVIWKWWTDEELEEMKRLRCSRGKILSQGKMGKIQRKTYSKDTRKLIYLNAGGRCELCGRKILLDDMTLDHVKPLYMGGEDDVSNLSCTCLPCNVFKGNILPEDFMDRINDIFWYQMEKKNHRNLLWIMVKKSVKKLIFG